jgi:hypothetical protein
MLSLPSAAVLASFHAVNRNDSGIRGEYLSACEQLWIVAKKDIRSPFVTGQILVLDAGRTLAS